MVFFKWQEWGVVIKTISPPLSKKKNIKTKRTKNRDQKWPNHDAYIHPNEHPRALVPVTNQKRRAHWWRPTGTRLKAIWQRRITETDSHPCTDPGSHGTNSRMLSLQDNHEPTHDIPRNKQPHTPCTGGVPSFPAFHSHLFSFISESCWQGLLYIQKVQIQKPTKTKR